MRQDLGAQNLKAARNTIVRGPRMADGDMNCGSVARTPVVGSVNAAASVRLRTCHTVAAFVRLSKSTVASSVRVAEAEQLAEPQIDLGQRIEPRVAQRLQVDDLVRGESHGAADLPRDRRTLLRAKLPLRMMSCHGSRVDPVSLNWFGRSAFDAPQPLQRLEPATLESR